MAWSCSRDNTVSTVGEILYLLKELLKTVGWTVQMSGDGVGAYDAAGDCITSGGAVANGLGNSSAWIRLQDPAGVREVLFQRGSGSDGHIRAWYSVAAQFTGGAPDTSTPATAADQVIWSEMSAAAGGLRFLWSVPVQCNIMVQSVGEDGVYAFYCVCHIAGTGGGAGWIVFEATDSTVGDNGPDGAVMQCGSYSVPPAVGTMAYASGPMLTGILLSTVDTEFYEVPGLLPNPTAWTIPAEVHPDAAGHYPLFPINYMRFNVNSGTKVGWKGQSKWLRWVPSSTFVIPDLIDEGGAYYMVYFGLALPGWPDATPPVL